MSRLGNLRYRDVAGLLRQHGFEPVRRGKGSHEIWLNRLTQRTTVLPRHAGTLPVGTLRTIIRQSGLSVDEFLG